MAREFGGDARAIRTASAQTIAQVSSTHLDPGNKSSERALGDLSLVFALIPNLNRWSADERQDVARVISAKAGSDESQYLRLMQRHARLRYEIIRLGS
jgi:hypothetical protein